MIDTPVRLPAVAAVTVDNADNALPIHVLPPPASKRVWWRRTPDTAKPLNLALQGGGAHGAYTWGVLDALLGDPRLRFEGVSGSSAGALNAVVMAHGWIDGGARDGPAAARQALTDFWTGVAALMPAGLVTQGDSEAIDLSPAGQWLLQWAGLFAPAQLNPLDINPLRDLLERQVDFERLRAVSPFKLFVGATEVNSGRLRLFREHELTLDMLLASACLPRLHHAVEIDGEPYWDGGYAANPAVFPLFYDCAADDVLLLLLTPLQRQGTPRSLPDIESRLADLAFSAHFMREMRAFAHARRFAHPGWWRRGRLERRLQRVRFHLIDADAEPSLHRGETRLLAHGPFLQRLHAQGQQRGADWLAAHGADIGQRSTMDLQRFA